MVSEKHNMIKLIKPYIAFEEVESEFKDVFESGWFTKGKFVQAFRDDLTAYTGAKYSFLTTSATTALTDRETAVSCTASKYCDAPT